MDARAKKKMSWPRFTGHARSPGSYFKHSSNHRLPYSVIRLLLAHAQNMSGCSSYGIQRKAFTPPEVTGFMGNLISWRHRWCGLGRRCQTKKKKSFFVETVVMCKIRISIRIKLFFSLVKFNAKFIHTWKKSCVWMKCICPDSQRKNVSVLTILSSHSLKSDMAHREARERWMDCLPNLVSVSVSLSSDNNTCYFNVLLSCYRGQDIV